MTRSLMAAALTLCALPAAAQDSPAWYVRGDVGGAEIHGAGGLRDAGLDSVWLGARVGRAFGESGILATDLGVGWGSSDGGFSTYTAGLELRAFTRSQVSPFIRLEVGYMTEPIGDCGVAGLGGGVSIRASRSVSLRGSVMSNVHCSDGVGPVGAAVGVELQW